MQKPRIPASSLPSRSDIRLASARRRAAAPGTVDSGGGIAASGPKDVPAICLIVRSELREYFSVKSAVFKTDVSFGKETELVPKRAGVPSEYREPTAIEEPQNFGACIAARLSRRPTVLHRLCRPQSQQRYQRSSGESMAFVVVHAGNAAAHLPGCGSPTAIREAHGQWRYQRRMD